ncbi:MAG: FkbM family methyltransferase [Thiobacillaceae bacterium]
MNPFSRLAIAAASFYLRLTPIPYGRWRLIRRFLPELRENGHDLGERLVRTRYDFKFRADLGDWLGQYVYLTGVYEPPTARVIAELLEPGETFIDVGANSGFFTLLASRRVGPAGRILSFEPVPSMHKRLLENIALNDMKNVSVQTVALSNAEGTLPLFEGPEGHKGISSLRHIDNSAATIEVKTMPLDKFRDTISTVTLVKIDVEGAEQLVLEGMAKMLNKDHPYLVIEITDEYLHAFGHTAARLANFLIEFGYRMYRIGSEGLVLMNAEQAADDDQFNALFAYKPVPETLLAP